MKDGVKTSEFWLKAVPTVMGLLVAAGVIEPTTEQAVNDLSGAALPIVQAVLGGALKLAGLGAAFYLSLRHGRERASLKAIEMKAGQK